MTVTPNIINEYIRGSTKSKYNIINVLNIYSAFSTFHRMVIFALTHSSATENTIPLNQVNAVSQEQKLLYIGTHFPNNPPIFCLVTCISLREKFILLITLSNKRNYYRSESFIMPD